MFIITYRVPGSKRYRNYPREARPRRSCGGVGDVVSLAPRLMVRERQAAAIERFFKNRDLDEQLHPTARLVYLYLVHRANGAGWSIPGVGTMAREMDLGETTIHRALRSLEAVGLIEIQAQQRANGSSTSNRYGIADWADRAEASEPTTVPQIPEVAAMGAIAQVPDATTATRDQVVEAASQTLDTVVDGEIQSQGLTPVALGGAMVAGGGFQDGTPITNSLNCLEKHNNGTPLGSVLVGSAFGSGDQSQQSAKSHWDQVDELAGLAVAAAQTQGLKVSHDRIRTKVEQYSAVIFRIVVPNCGLGQVAVALPTFAMMRPQDFRKSPAAWLVGTVPRFVPEVVLQPVKPDGPKVMSGHQWLGREGYEQAAATRTTVSASEYLAAAERAAALVPCLRLRRRPAS